MTSLLYDAVAINRTDVVDLLIELCYWALICSGRTDVRSSLGAPVALKELRKYFLRFSRIYKVSASKLDSLFLIIELCKLT